MRHNRHIASRRLRVLSFDCAQTAPLAASTVPPHYSSCPFTETLYHRWYKLNEARPYFHNYLLEQSMSIYDVI